MKLTPISTPTAIQPNTTGASEAKTRAVEAFMKGTTVPSQVAEKIIEREITPQAQETAVRDPNNISPEEMSAVKPPTPDPKQVDESTPSEDTPQPEAPRVDPATETRFKEIARQERILRARAEKQAAEIKSQQAALAAQKADLEAKAKQYDPSNYIAKDRLRADPLAVLAEAELSYDDLTQRLLNQQPIDPRMEAQVKRLESTIARLEARLEETSKASQDEKTSQYQAALSQIEKDAASLVRSNPAEFEAIAKTGSVKDVVELIERTFKEDGYVMDTEDAAREVENYIVEEGYKTINRIDKIKKRLGLANADAAKASQGTKQTQATQADTKQPGTMKTLTNATSSTRQLSARERALLAFKGELKS